MARKSEWVTINGKTMWITGSTQQERYEKAAQMMLDAGMLATATPARNQTTFAQYAQTWYKTYKQGKIRHTTEAEYRSILRKHLLPYFGDMCLADIDAATIQQMLDTKADMSKKTVHEMMLVLGMVLESALMDRLIPCNPARDKRLQNPATRKNKRKALTAAELSDILSHIPDLTQASDRRFLALLAYTGMRREEALGLRWQDVDLDNRWMHIHCTITFKGNHPVEGPTKTENGNRWIVLPEPLACILATDKQAEGFVVKDDITSSYVKRMLERINREIDLHGSTPHCFRHTWLTLCYHRGVDEKTLQALGGWGDIATMREVYMHVHEDDKAKAQQTIDKLFAELA